MRTRIILSMTTLFLACFTVAAWSSSLTAQPVSRPRFPQNGSVIARISSVGDGSISVDVRTSRDPVIVDFLIDGQAKIDGGGLEVGSVATVDYRTDGGDTIARHIVLRSAIHSN